MADRTSRRGRYVALALFLLACFGLVIFRLVQIQLLQAGRYEDIAQTQRLEEVKLEPQRGFITDRDGRQLAFSKEVKTVYATPSRVTDPEMAAAELAIILQVPKEKLLEKLTSKSGFQYIVRKIDPDIAERVKAAGIPGIGLIDESTRCYPAQTLAAQLIGYVGMDNTGLAGLEYNFNELLAGTKGEQDVENDAAGNPIPGVGTLKKAPVDGSSLELTIDEDIQFKAESLLDSAVQEYSAKNGTLVLMDCRTGEILAMANSPLFDLNLFPSTDPEVYRNHAVCDAFEPGSVLKVVTAAGALQERVMTPSTVLSIPRELQIADRTFSDFHEMPSSMTFTQIIAQSSNVGTIQVAQALGKEQLYNYMQLFGFGKTTGLEFPGEGSGRLPALNTWSAPSLATIGIGQGISVTTTQVARMLAAIGSGGLLVQPKLVKAVIDPSGKRTETSSAEPQRVITEDVAAQVKDMLEEVVINGTGTRAATNLYTCAGKTGTGLKASPLGGYEDNYMASFAGFAPAEQPVLAMAVVLDSPSTIYGGEVAAPVFSQVMEFALRHLEIPPSASGVQ